MIRPKDATKDFSATNGWESGGSAGMTRSPSGSGSEKGARAALYTPPCFAWSTSLSAILDDFDGLQLFKKYLRREGCEAVLDFFFAHKALSKDFSSLDSAEESEGKEIREKIKKLSYDMDRSFLRNPSNDHYIHSLIAIPQPIRDEVHRFVREKTSTLWQYPDLFQPPLQAVLVFLQDKHSQLVQDDMYIEYVQEVEAGLGSSSSSSTSHLPAASSGPLATLDEDTALAAKPPPLPPRLHPPPLPPPPPSSSRHKDRRERRLNSKLLQSTASQRVANLQPAPSGPAPHPYHSSYVARLPPSTQDSELASMSSDADSLTQRPHDSTVKRIQRHQSTRNWEANAAEKFIPRTQVEKAVGGGERVHETEEGRRSFAALLTEKLERVASRVEVETKLQQCLRDLPDSSQAADLKKKAAAQTAAAIQKHAELEGDETCSILDAHMNHINWDDSKKATPTALRSPGPPQATFPFHLRPAHPRSSRSPDQWHSPALPPPPMTTSYPSPFANSSALIKPLSASRSKPGGASPALQRHRAAQQTRLNPAVATLINRASDTSGIESGSSSNPSLVSAFLPAPPQLPGGSLHRHPKPGSLQPRSNRGPEKKTLSNSLNRSLTRSRRSDPPPLFSPTPGHLALVYSLPDEEVPYAVTCPTTATFSGSLTLKEVKSKLPKKNQDSKEFKYFFKCKDEEESEMWTEVESESSPVPLWNSGKIMAKIVHQ